VREHLIVTPEGRISMLVQIPGNRHDVQGLYALLNTTFRGHLIGDNAYWPREEMDHALIRHGICMTAKTREGFKFEYPACFRDELKRERAHIERRISLFNIQFHAGRTLNRSKHHYLARRWTKALAHNLTREINASFGLPLESIASFRAVA
jgi:hypothetical protein